jgi:hypothetical protein
MQTRAKTFATWVTEDFSPQFCYRVLRVGEHPFNMRVPNWPEIVKLSPRQLRDIAVCYVWANANDQKYRSCDMLSVRSHASCVRFASDRKHIYGDKPVFVKIDMSYIEDQCIWPIHTPNNAMFHMHSEAPRISHRGLVGRLSWACHWSALLCTSHFYALVPHGCIWILFACICL